jgi:hypothetical protein
MIDMVKPKFFIPVHAGRLRRTYHADLGVEQGVPRDRVLLPDNGSSLEFTADSVKNAGTVPNAVIYIGENGDVVKPKLPTTRLGGRRGPQVARTKSKTDPRVAAEQRRFQEMRKRLLVRK